MTQSGPMKILWVAKLMGRGLELGGHLATQGDLPLRRSFGGEGGGLQEAEPEVREAAL